MAKERCKWSQKEDEILKIAVGKDVERVDWLSIAEYLPGRNNKDCRKRWHQKFATNTNYGTWSEQEDERLHMAVNQHGVKWALVAQVVGTRSSEQCSKRWKDVLNPELSRSPWAEGDDNLLLSSVDTHGRNWKMIAELHFRDRSTLSLKNRHALLLRRQSRESQSRENIPQSPYADSGIGSASRQITLTTPSDSPPSSHGDPGDVVADELGNIPNNQNDFQYPLPHSNRTDAQIGRTNEIAVASPNGLEGDGFIPFGQSSNASIDMSAYDNDALMSEMSRFIPDPSFLPGQPQQSHQQQHPYSDMSAFNHHQAAIDFSLPLTAPSSMVPTPKAPSDDLESWEDFLCLGINCPRKGLEAFKTAVLEAATKGPGCQGDGDDEKVQIMLKIRKKN